MQSFLVEVAAIVLNRPARIGQAVEQFQVQAFVPQAAVEALIDAILPRLAWFNIRRLDLLFRQPVLDRRGNELRAVVTAEILRKAMEEKQKLQDFDHLRRRDRIVHVRLIAFPRELVHHR